MERNHLLPMIGILSAILTPMGTMFAEEVAPNNNISSSLAVQGTQVLVATPCPPPEEPPAEYSYELKFTISALGEITYKNMFHRKVSASDVVDYWHLNTYSNCELEDPVYDTLHGTLLALRNYLLDTRAPELSFREMMEDRLKRTLPQGNESLDKLINSLICAGFRFPLLDPSSGSSPQKKLRLLRRFLVDYKGPNRGGLGNVPMSMYFEMPAAPWLFSEKFIEKNVLAMQNEVIPAAELMVLIDGEYRIKDEGECCCNESDHNSIYFPQVVYRKCHPIGDNGYYCRERSGYCTLGNMNKCRDGHSHPLTGKQ